MRNFRLGVGAVALLTVWGSLLAAEPAGKVLVVAGPAVAVRGGAELPLSRGSVVESGDLLRVGDNGSIQVRFNDETVIALRANTQFKVDEFRYSGKGDSDKSAFSLLKGGFRVITGLIGKQNPNNVTFGSSTATIGIRGTHFTIVSCNSDCRGSDGSLAENGTYGSVTEGRIVVSNRSGQSEFSRDQYFVVPNINAPAQPLMAPPSFLRDKLDGTARNQSGTREKTSETQTAKSSGSQESSVSTTPQTIATNVTSHVESAISEVAQTITQYAPSAQPGLQGLSQQYSYTQVTSTTGRDSVSSPAGFDPYLYSAQVLAEFGAGYSDNGNEEFAAARTGAGALAAHYLLANDSGSGIVKDAALDTGTSADAGNVYWGRYRLVETEGTGESASVRTSIIHWLVGDPVLSLPTSGIYAYSHVGGTNPTDQLGRVGTLTSGGAWSVNFNGTAPTIRTTSDVTWTIPSAAGTVAYAVSVPQQAMVRNSPVLESGTNFTRTTTSYSSLTATATCNGGGCTAATASVAPQFTGSAGQGLATAISAQGSMSGGTTQSMSTVQVYKRGSSPSTAQ